MPSFSGESGLQMAAATLQSGPMVTHSACPQWLPDFLNADYFSSCPLHSAAHKSERNFFCIDCAGPAHCVTCLARNHESHAVLQVRRSSYHEVVRVADVSRLLDLSNIQGYVINSAKIVFLNARPQARPVKGAPYHCEGCSRTLIDPVRFCSIGCKLEAAAVDPNLTLTPRPGTGQSSFEMQQFMAALRKPHHVPQQKAHKVEKKRPRSDSDSESNETSEGSEGSSSTVLQSIKRRNLVMKELTIPSLSEYGDYHYNAKSHQMHPITPPLRANSVRKSKRKGFPYRSPMV